MGDGELVPKQKKYSNVSSARGASERYLHNNELTARPLVPDLSHLEQQARHPCWNSKA